MKSPTDRPLPDDFAVVRDVLQMVKLNHPITGEQSLAALDRIAERQVCVSEVPGQITMRCQKYAALRRACKEEK